MNSCAYYDVFDECYAKLDAMIRTINEQHEHFVIEMRDYGLLHGTDPNLPFARLKASLFDVASLPSPASRILLMIHLPLT